MKARWHAETSPLAFGWRRGLAYALLWATAIGALETVLPASTVHPGEFALIALRAVPEWLLAASLLMVSTSLAVPRLSSLQLLLVTAVMAMLITLLRATLRSSIGELSLFPSLTLMTASDVYLAWGQLLYGGLFVAGCTLAFRTERTRAMLGRAEIARSRSETLFSQAQLAGLQGSVDPAFLLRALDEMRSRYASDAAGADRLLDQLVGLLRLAMPGVRSGHSTLGAELAVARSWAQLGAELDPHRAGWHCEIDGALVDLPFPPLLLPSLLEQLAASTAGAMPVSLMVTRGASQVTLALHGTAQPGWLADELLHRLHVGLYATHGNAAYVVLTSPAAAGAADAAVLTLTLPLESPSPAPHRRLDSSQPPKEIHHGRGPQSRRPE